VRRKRATLKAMKTAALPSIRIEPQLRAELESVLADGESLSSFVEASVRRAVEYRRVQTDFHARGQASWEEFQRTGVSHSVDEVLDRLRQKTAARRAEFESRSNATSDV
jgi:Arc/MetJ-type ribon-helix-helix transcriptional regulator